MTTTGWGLATTLIAGLCWATAALAAEPTEQPAPPPTAGEGPADGAKPDEAKPEPDGAKPEGATPDGAKTPTRAPVRLPRAPGLPDGTFGGALSTPGGEVEVRLLVSGGLYIRGEARLADGRVIALEPVGSRDAAHLRLGGRDGGEFLRVGVELFDPERGTGEFNGVLGRKRLDGQWTAERR